MTHAERLREWAAGLDVSTEDEATELVYALGVISGALMGRLGSGQLRRRPLEKGEVLRLLKPPKPKPGKSVAKATRERLVAAEGRCSVCSSTTYLEVDHIVPRRRGGTNDEANLQVLCRSCNGKKHKKTMDEWLGSGRKDGLAR